MPRKLGSGERCRLVGSEVVVELGRRRRRRGKGKRRRGLGFDLLLVVEVRRMAEV